MATLSSRKEYLNKSDTINWAVVAAVLLIAGCWGLRELLRYHLLTCVGILLLPVVAHVDRQQLSGSYLLPALLITTAAFVAPVKTLLYFAWLFSIFLLVEKRYGRLNHLPLFTAGIVSPIFNYLLSIFGFPLRLQLTQLAGNMLAYSHSAVVEGNIIIYQGEEFSVDPACMGLNLTVVALLIGVIFLARIEKQKNKSLPFSIIVAVLMGFFLLNIGANLARIVLLVFFRIAPGTALHDLVGILCLLLYVALPGYGLIQLLAKRISESSPVTVTHPNRKQRILPAGIPVMLILLLVGYTELHHAESPRPKPLFTRLGDFTISSVANDIIKLENKTALVYMKKIRAFYNTEHNPMVCWTGSGYSFQKVKSSYLNGFEVYEGQLVKGTDILYTAWWYSNGEHHTISQWDWRWRVCQGEQPFYLINITAETPEVLREEIAGALQMNIFQRLMN